MNQIPFYQEVCVFTWRLMTNNQHVFEDFTMRDDFHSKFVVGILILLDSSKKNHTKSNLMYLCIFMMLSISASRELAMTLNEPFTNSAVKFDMPEYEQVSYNDLIFLSIYKLI